MAEETSSTLLEKMLIRGPSHAKILLGSGENKQTEPRDNLTGIYLNSASSNPLRNRKYSQLPSIQELIKFCEANLVESTDTTEHKKNTIKFLAKLGCVKTKATPNFDLAIRDFLKKYFKLENKNKKVKDLCGECIDLILSQLPERSIPFTSGVKGLEGLKKLRFMLSLWVNDSKEDYSKMSPHIWLSKIPQLKFGSVLKDIVKPALVVSAVDRGEYRTFTSKVASPFFWHTSLTPQIYLSRFIDYARFHRKADYKQWENPETQQKFKNQDEWNVYLDLLYKDIYYAVRLMQDKISQGENILIHCKAGKGRSVMALAVYYYLNPQELGIELSNNISAIDIDQIWNKMILGREHIDKDADSKMAVSDCVMYIYTQKYKWDKISIPEIYKYFNDNAEASTSISLSFKKTAQQE